MDQFDKYYSNKGNYHVAAYQEDELFKKYIDSIVAFFDDKVGQTILNVGAGEGVEAEKLLEKGHNVSLLDISSIALISFIERTRAKYNVNCFYDDFTKFTFKYDWILIPNTLHWIEDEEAAVKKIKELAIKGAYITVPDIPRSPLDLRGYTKERLEELFPNSEVYFQDGVRWVVIYKHE